MLTYNNGETLSFIGQRVGPVHYTDFIDPYDTYISQNQNTLAVTLLGDTTTIGGVLKRDPYK